MKHSKLLERAMKLQEKIESKSLPVKIGIGLHNDLESYLYIEKEKENPLDSGLHFSHSSYSDTQIINLAKNFLKPKYTKLKKLCINSLNESVYIKKDYDYVELDIVSITKDGLSLSDGNVYSQNEIYIEE